MIIRNIGQLVGIVPEGVLRKEGRDQGETGILENAWLRTRNGLIEDFGPMTSCPCDDNVKDAGGGMLTAELLTKKGYITMPAAAKGSSSIRSTA